MSDSTSETKKYCVIVDDDQFALDKLSEYIQQLSGFEILASFNDPVAALQEIPNLPNVDFIFLDVEMPRITGIELAKQIRAKTKYLIFTTGHSSYAFDAFEVTADQFLLKPFSFADFASKVQSVLLKNVSKAEQKREEDYKESFFIKTGQKNNYLKVNPADILFIEAAKNYVVINCKAEQHISYMRLNHVEEALDPKKFLRIGKSFIVAIDAIQRVEGNTLKLTDGNTLQVGDKYKDKFLAFLNNYLLKRE